MANLNVARLRLCVDNFVVESSCDSELVPKEAFFLFDVLYIYCTGHRHPGSTQVGSIVLYPTKLCWGSVEASK